MLWTYMTRPTQGTYREDVHLQVCGWGRGRGHNQTQPVTVMQAQTRGQ